MRVFYRVEKKKTVATLHSNTSPGGSVSVETVSAQEQDRQQPKRTKQRQGSHLRWPHPTVSRVPGKAELASGAATFATSTRRLRIGLALRHPRSSFPTHHSIHRPSARVCGRSRAIFTPLPPSRSAGLYLTSSPHPPPAPFIKRTLSSPACRRAHLSLLPCVVCTGKAAELAFTTLSGHCRC